MSGMIVRTFECVPSILCVGLFLFSNIPNPSLWFFWWFYRWFWLITWRYEPSLPFSLCFPNWEINVSASSWIVVVFLMLMLYSDASCQCMMNAMMNDTATWCLRVISDIRCQLMIGWMMLRLDGDALIWCMMPMHDRVDNTATWCVIPDVWCHCMLLRCDAEVRCLM